MNFGTDLDNPNFADVATALGIHGRGVERPDEPAEALRAAFDHRGPALVEAMTARQELSVPPTITFDQVKGFALYAARTVLSGGGDELLDPARTNVMRRHSSSVWCAERALRKPNTGNQVAAHGTRGTSEDSPCRRQGPPPCDAPGPRQAMTVQSNGPTVHDNPQGARCRRCPVPWSPSGRRRGLRTIGARFLAVVRFITAGGAACPDHLAEARASLAPGLDRLRSNEQ
ncbi:thiamine pyrophosphate-dependent enzyme [Streptomyces sp. NPDC002758]